MKKQLKRWASASHAKNMLKDDSGAAMVEYGLLVGLIAVVCIVGVSTMGGNVKDIFCAINTAIAGVPALAAAGAGAGC